MCDDEENLNQRVELVESLGPGISRILRAYGEDCFKFTDRYMDKLDRILDEQIQNHNEALEEDERRE